MSGDREGESPGLVEVQMADLEHCFLGRLLLEIEGLFQKHKIRMLETLAFEQSGGCRVHLPGVHSFRLCIKGLLRTCLLFWKIDNRGPVKSPPGGRSGVVDKVVILIWKI